LTTFVVRGALPLLFKRCAFFRISQMHYTVLRHHRFKQFAKTPIASTSPKIQTRSRRESPERRCGNLAETLRKDFGCISSINWNLTMQSPSAIRNVSCGTFEESASSVRKMRSIFRTCSINNDKLNFIYVVDIQASNQSILLSALLYPIEFQYFPHLRLNAS